jgi:predicted PurR-regulated permease PerM
VSKPSTYDYAAWIIAALGLWLVLQLHLLPALIAGLLVVELVRSLLPLFARHLSTRRAKEVALAVVALFVVGAVSAAGIGIVAYMRSEGGSVSVLLARMADILETSRSTLPAWLAGLLPANSEAIGDRASEWLRAHAAELQQFGRETGRLLAHLLAGLVIGALVSLREAYADDAHGPLAGALAERLRRLREAFRRVVFAQLRISAINTVLTALYLALLLPLIGVSLPLTKTMIVVTFVAGLLPVVGNLISNTVIVVVSLANSGAIALVSLAFLVLVHKLEYLLNARIVGAQIRSSAWELLTAMLVMESAFGLAGLVAAPIAYAWLKDELVARRLI